MKMVVGLGNPGDEYERTRHNAGFRVIDRLGEKLSATDFQKEHDALIAKTSETLLVKPMTFMNNSGDPVADIIESRKIGLSEVLVVTDDINLPLGSIRLRASGSTGGHNGLASIECELATEEYARLRIGVGSCKSDDQIDYVLGEFLSDEGKIFEEAVSASVEAICLWLEKDLAAAQEMYNSWRSSATDMEE